MAEHEETYDKEAVRARIAMPQLCAQLGIELAQSGHRWLCCCPFHAERTASFTVTCEDKKGWHFHCFGCAAHGDVFDLWMRRQGGEFKDALKALAGIAGLGSMPSGWKPARPPKKKSEPIVKPVKVGTWPRLRRLSDATCEELARLRGLSIDGIMAAREAGMVWGGVFGMSERYWGESGSCMVYGDRMEHEEKMGKLRIGPERCWVVYDGAKMGVQVRRLNGEKWVRHDKGEYKGHTLGTSKWPLGVNLIGDRRRVALVEGGPDILACYHFLDIAGRLKDIAVVGVLGAGVRLHPEALPYFAHRRVRIFAHDDKTNPINGQQAGYEAAVRWMNQLTAVGAEVDVYDFIDLRRGRPYPGEKDFPAEGIKVGDLNDAALGDEECLRCLIEGDSMNAPAMEFHPTIDTDG